MMTFALKTIKKVVLSEWARKIILWIGMVGMCLLGLLIIVSVNMPQIFRIQMDALAFAFEWVLGDFFSPTDWTKQLTLEFWMLSVWLATCLVEAGMALFGATSLSKIAIYVPLLLLLRTVAFVREGAKREKPWAKWTLVLIMACLLVEILWIVHENTMIGYGIGILISAIVSIGYFIYEVQKYSVENA
jgi:hypothetical protein